MAKIELSRKEIEKMIKDQLGCKSVTWDEDGNALVELNVEELKKREVEVVKEEHHYHDRWPYPIYIGTPVRPPYHPYWTVRNVTKTPRLTYSASAKGVSVGKTE